MTKLRRIDLNLLVILDAMLRERHVTRAAQSVGLSQPAMSSALARLRHALGDELFVRTATGMQPTPRAIALIEPVRQALGQIARLLEPDHGFDPCTSVRRYVVRLSDLLGYILLPRLVSEIARTAPHVSLDVVHLSPLQTSDALERDEVDVAVSTGLAHSSSICHRELFPDRMVCVMRAGHPLASRKLTLDRFLASRHLKVSMSPTDTRFVDDVLASWNTPRNVALNVPHWLLVPRVLEQTDYMAVMPETFAAAIADATLVVRDLPLAAKPFDWCLYWHRRQDNDPGSLWLRNCIVEACRARR